VKGSGLKSDPDSRFDFDFDPDLKVIIAEEIKTIISIEIKTFPVI
jgi:hypothetical protein